MHNTSIIYSPRIVKAVNFMIQVPWVVRLPADFHCCRTLCSEGCCPSVGGWCPSHSSLPRVSKARIPTALNAFSSLCSPMDGGIILQPDDLARAAFSPPPSCRPPSCHPRHHRCPPSLTAPPPPAAPWGPPRAGPWWGRRGC